MKKLIRPAFFWILLLFLLLYVLFSIKIFQLDYRLAHQSHNVYKLPFDWNKYLLTTPVKKILIKIFDNDKIGLPRVNIYIDKELQKKLLMNVPTSTRNYQKASILSDRNEMKNIELRYRGDNPLNWLIEKKSIRIRYKKNEMLNRQRFFEYWPLTMQFSSKFI